MRFLVLAIFISILSGCNLSQNNVEPHLLFHKPNDVPNDALVAQSYLLLAQEAYRLKDFDYEFEILTELAEYEYGPAQLQIAKSLLKGHGQNYVQGSAIEWATKAAERDYTPAIMFLAKWYRFGGDGVKADLKKSMNLYARAIELGEPSAATELGYIFIRHWKEEKGYETAQQLFANAAYQGDIKALCGLGVVYRESKTLGDLNKAKDYFQVSYARGHQECAFELGYLYHTSLLDTEQALYWYTTAAKHGESDALNNLGMMYNNGDGVAVNFALAKTYFEQAIELGSKSSYGNLGRLFEVGNGVTQNYEQAITLYEQGAQLQDAQSIHNLASLYNEGLGVEQDRRKALVLFEQAANLGNRFSAFHLADAYFYGDGKAQSKDLALEYYLLSAKAGYAPSFCKAAEVVLVQSWTLAKSYFFEGAKLGQQDCLINLVRGMRFNREKDLPVVEVLKSFANRNDVMAVEELGKTYQNGDFGELISFDTAKLYYLRAGALGSGSAMARLGVLYEQGELVEQNLERAAALYARAADSGSALGKNNLATFYLNGVVVKKNKSKAEALYEQAAKDNHIAAMLNLGDLYLDKGEEGGLEKACALFKKAHELGAMNTTIRHSNCLIQQGVDALHVFELLGQSADNCQRCVVKQFELIVANRVPNKTIQDALILLKSAAKSGNASAALKMGVWYESDVQHPKNMQLALNWYQTAVMLGEVEALNKVAEFYWYGKGVKKNEDKAIEAISQLARANNFNVASFIGEHFYHGINIGNDYAKARRYFIKAAEQNDDIALNSLGEIYRDGLHVTVDTSLALNYFKRSASLGLPDAMHNLGALNLSIDKKEDGLAWLQRAADMQFVKSYILLGDYYAQKTSSESVRKALKWLQLAAGEEALEGMYKLAMLLKRQNSDVYTTEAKKLLRAAASRGHEEAETIVKELEVERE
ncbi:SEL1-like repeat protein [Pseudoalteromonas luteoviolacea]|nr:tetratricopeptide repeat protein [Pseudoalteromonas luteoviolacea]